MESQLSPSDIVNKMLLHDAFSKWLGIEILALKKGYCKLSITVTGDMLNGFHIAHGGITYSISDSALAFASNSYGQKCVSVETSISHIAPVKAGDKLTAVAIEKSRTNKIGIYEVTVYNQEQILVALFKGNVYITNKIWE
ncbi:MAG: hydroxyphenylacetyl-CoA thioesterase PaaI [Vicingaceae bacterium]